MNYNTRIDVNLGSKASFEKAEAKVNGLEKAVDKAMKNALDEIGKKFILIFFWSKT